MEHYFTNNENLKSEIRTINYSYDANDFVFLSDLGVFSKDKIDYGSKVLVENYLKYNHDNKKILDVGCGYGFIGIVLSKVTNSYVEMVDVNKRALHLTERNINENKVNAKAYMSDAYQSVKDKYDVIITNPPIRAGKEKVLEILNGSVEHLNSGGELWFVIRKDQGAKSIVKVLNKELIVENTEKSKGFYIFRAKKYWKVYSFLIIL